MNTIETTALNVKRFAKMRSALSKLGYFYVVFFLVFIFASFPKVSCHAQTTNQKDVSLNLSKSLNNCLHNSLTKFKIPGVIAAICTPTGKILKGAAGWADLNKQTPMTTQMHMRIGSVTKTYTATLILQLVDENKIKLDQPINDYLKIPIANGNRITIRHLLQMRSGLGNYCFNTEFAKAIQANPNRTFTPLELVQYSNYTKAPSGKTYDYNNANYILLGLLIQKITQSSFKTQVTKRILKPLKMKHSLVAHDCRMPSPYAKGYIVKNGKAMENSCYMRPTTAWSAGNIVSTVDDQLIWIKALAKGSLISKKSREAQREFLPCGKKTGLSYGLGLADYLGGVGHSGNYSHVYTSIAMRYLGYDIVIMVNGQNNGGNSNVSKASGIYAEILKFLEY